MVCWCFPKVRDKRWESHLIRSSKYFAAYFLLSASELISFNLLFSFSFSLGIFFSLSSKLRSFCELQLTLEHFKSFVTNYWTALHHPCTTRWVRSCVAAAVGRSFSHMHTPLLYKLICVVAMASAFAEAADCLTESHSGTARLERDWVSRQGWGSCWVFT